MKLRTLKSAILAGVAATPLLLAQAMAQSAPSEDSVIIVTGTRVADRTALDTAVAVDVVGVAPDQRLLEHEEYEDADEHGRQYRFGATLPLVFEGLRQEVHERGAEQRTGRETDEMGDGVLAQPGGQQQVAGARGEAQEGPEQREAEDPVQ